MWKCIYLGCYLWWEIFIVVISGLLAIDVECAWWASNERSMGRPQIFPSHQWDKFARSSTKLDGFHQYMLVQLVIVPSPNGAWNNTFLPLLCWQDIFFTFKPFKLNWNSVFYCWNPCCIPKVLFWNRQFQQNDTCNQYLPILSTHLGVWSFILQVHLK